MTNHVTPDGLLNAETCERPIRYRDPNLILQDTCTPEPRLDVIVQEIPDDPAGQGYAFLELDVTRATKIRDALNAFLRTAQGTTAWQYDGVAYNLDVAWEGRPGTDYEGLFFRHTGNFHRGLPFVVAEPRPGETIYAALPVVLGLKPCMMHGIYSAPCYMCLIENVGDHLHGDETADVNAVAYGEGFEPRGDQ